jgi:exopolysaccharide biosynthesis predicted pyruvyltransferase EpsI
VKNTSINDVAEKRLVLINSIISLGEVIITDRLHCSIISLLMGKPHVMLNEKYNKIQNTRETALKNKPDCSSDKIMEYYANDIEEAIIKAINLLNH